MAKLVNSASAAVDDLLNGCLGAWPSLAMLEGHKVVVRSDFETVRDSGAVALISGGGSGHEPAHVGYVGKGMLTAAVCGEIFTSPSTDAVLAALRAVTGSGGALLIVKNYTGDRLNFGLAAEIARSEGLRVEMVIVGDDAALSDTDSAGRRGIAGSILVHKVAGAAAQAGLPLEAVRAAAVDAAESIATMGVALRPCTLPGADHSNFELPDNQVAFGLGIHGERGCSYEPFSGAASIIGRLCRVVCADRELVEGDRIALMVNNLGGTSPMELFIAANEAVEATRQQGLTIERMWAGTFLTALDMSGCSITVMRLTPSLLDALDAPCQAPAWPGLGRTDGSIRRVLTTTSVPEVRRRGHGKAASTKLRSVLAEVARALNAAEPTLTELDRQVGDGDLGINLARGANAVAAQLDTISRLHPADALSDLAAIVRRTVGGTSGALYSAGLLRAGAHMDAYDVPGPSEWAGALAEAAGAISLLGDAEIGDRTMLDALIPAAEALCGSETSDAGASLSAAIAAAEAGAASTESIKARRGRASYIGKQAIGTRDPGAEAVLIWLRATQRALTA